MCSNDVIYALVTKRCNLSCPHCDVYKLEDEWNEEKFLEQLRKYNGRIIIFGGECSLYPERIKLLLEDPDIKDKVVSLSTNLLILDNKLISYYEKIKYLATSWNPGRFIADQYNRWIENIKKLSNYNIDLICIITLTDSLFKYNFEELLSILHELDSIGNISNIKFENYIGPGTNREYFKRADEFLCRIYEHWNFRMRLDFIDRVQNFYVDCSGIKHLNPDGSIHIGCSHDAQISYASDCLLCGNSNICKPCQLQRYCTVPYNFTKKVYDDIKNGKIKAIDCFEQTKLDLEEINNVNN